VGFWIWVWFADENGTDALASGWMIQSSPVKLDEPRKTPCGAGDPVKLDVRSHALRSWDLRGRMKPTRLTPKLMFSLLRTGQAGWKMLV
jgi:hypothetical protein